MARNKAGEPSKSAWFRELFTARPELLKKGSNKEVVALWEADHPGEEMSGGHKNAMANVKSTMKSRKRKGGRPKKVVENGTSPAAVKPGRKPMGGDRLEQLEFAIDRCLMAARNFEIEGIDKVVNALRSARNQVVMLEG